MVARPAGQAQHPGSHRPGDRDAQPGPSAGGADPSSRAAPARSCCSAGRAAWSLGGRPGRTAPHLPSSPPALHCLRTPREPLPAHCFGRLPTSEALTGSGPELGVGGVPARAPPLPRCVGSVLVARFPRPPVPVVPPLSAPRKSWEKKNGALKGKQAANYYRKLLFQLCNPSV